MPRPPQPITLSQRKQASVVKLLRAGYSQKLAARRVGCSMAAIRRTAKADARFAATLRRAESAAEGILLVRIRDAAADDKNWRAAAWLLERTQPSRYAARKPQQITRQQMLDVLDQFAEIIVDEVPAARQRKGILKRLSSAIRTPRGPKGAAHG